MELIRAHEEKLRDFVASAVSLAALELIPEFTFSKTPMTTPEGGLYLVQIVHIQGPKIQLQE